jgi:hypothetical protein
MGTRRSAFLAVYATWFLSGAMAIAGPPAAKSWSEFKLSIAAYPYAMAPARAAKIRAGAPGLRRCMDESHVLAALGAPDFETQSFRSVGGRPSEVGNVWHYVFADAKGEDNVADLEVSAWFENHRLTALTMSGLVTGIPGIAPSKGETCAAPAAKEHP